MRDCVEVLLSFINADWSSWPLVIMVTAYLIERRYHSEISSMIGRISVVKWGESKIEMNSEYAQSKQLMNDISNEGKGNYEDLKKYFEFEMLYNMAYRSQLQMMITIKNMNNMPMPYFTAMNFFVLHRSSLPIMNQSIANEMSYFQWLIDMKLVNRNQDNSFVLTMKGVEFVGYIYMRNYNLNNKNF